MVEYARFVMREGDFTAVKPTWANYLLSLPLGIWSNSGSRRRFLGEWVGRIKAAAAS
jgi:hypothetical protein